METINSYFKVGSCVLHKPSGKFYVIKWTKNEVMFVCIQSNVYGEYDRDSDNILIKKSECISHMPIEKPKLDMQKIKLKRNEGAYPLITGNETKLLLVDFYHGFSLFRVHVNKALWYDGETVYLVPGTTGGLDSNGGGNFPHQGWTLIDGFEWDDKE